MGVDEDYCEVKKIKMNRLKKEFVECAEGFENNYSKNFCYILFRTKNVHEKTLKESIHGIQ